MDRSVDSIGSCSLDVDADSSDISDTSGSLNFPTPISIKDITREFTANIRERCSVRTMQTTSTAIVDPATGKVRTVLTQPIGGAPGSVSPHVVDAMSCEKKPSYLNLACCVNGYSNMTTYDSKIRQDINKSREVSPIRPSTNSLQYCKKNNSLAPPILLPLPTVSVGPPRTSAAANNSNNNGSNGNGHEYGENGREPSSAATVGNGAISFIQQSVERLYGPGALAQGFYSPKKLRGSSSTRTLVPRPPDGYPSELTRKFQELSPGKDYSKFRKKLNLSAPNSVQHIGAVAAPSSTAPASGGTVDVNYLPVMRHLSQEFRAQLTTISPKKNYMSSYASKEDIVDPSKGTPPAGEAYKHDDEVDHKAVAVTWPSLHVDRLPGDHVNGAAKLLEQSTESREPQKDAATNVDTTKDYPPPKDGNHFIVLLKSEQARLLSMAIEVEKYIDALSNNPEIAEDTLGLLRSASGKARLLVSQKMKQFEGLCHNNLNRSPEDKFPTTFDDLQGFWDMVNLQVDNIDTIFANIEAMKNNDWKHPKETASTATKSQKPTKTVSSTRVKPAGTAKGVAKTSAAASAAALNRESLRKQIQELKRKQRLALAGSANANPAGDAPKSDVADDRAVDKSPVVVLVAENGCALPN